MGRPRKERVLDRALAPHGGFRAVVLRMAAAGATDGEIAAFVIRESGQYIGRTTVQRYRARLAQEAQKEEGAVT